MANTHPIALFDLDGTLLDSYQAILSFYAVWQLTSIRAGAS